jgi:uncharacterized protein (DUF427 family)
LERTDHVTYCPYKGDCSYYSVSAGGNLGEHPKPARHDHLKTGQA